MNLKNQCYCGNEKAFADCCGPFLNKTKNPENAEALMRSRYCAFVIKDFDYILATHDPSTQKNLDMEGNQQWANSVQFTKLDVIKTREFGEKAIVEFCAHFTESGEEKIHQELSTFRKISGKWYYSRGK